MINLGTSTMQDFALGGNLVERIDLGDTTIFDPYTTLTGTLPLTFNSRVAAALKNYRIHGTSAGSGTPTESGEPAGYKIPISLESREQQSNYDLYIGSTKLGEEEFVDYGEQKVYKDVSGVLTPTDPPAPLPAIQTYQGENTLSSTETVGEVTVKGRIAPMYRQVEYLKSTGTQYIDTDIIPTYSTKTELDIKFSDIVASADNDHSYFFGISGASVLGVYNALLQRKTSNDVEDIGVYDGFYYSAGGISLLKNLSVKTRNILTINRPISSWGSTTVSTDKTITAVTPTVGLCIFGLKAISGGQQVFLTQTSRNMFLYECKIYLDGSTVSNDLIPVERYDGVLGLYDKITGKFYTNVGTGEFVKGEYV